VSIAKIDYTPLPVHAPFHTSTMGERAMFGGYGSGKSYALCAEAIAVGLEQPGSEILIARKTVTSLRDTTEAIFVSILSSSPELWKACKTSRAGNHYSEITLPNGTVYYFRGMDNWMKHKSLSLAFIFYDELDELNEEIYAGMMSRVRQSKPTRAAREMGFHAPITRRGIVAASNPAGRNWVWDRFVGPNKVDNSAHFISTSLDNPYLPFDYLDKLMSYPKPWIRRYVLCSFDEFGGAIYGDWTMETHVVKPFREYPNGHYFLMGFDPGTSAGNAALWCCYDPEKHRLVGVAEYNETGLAATRHAARWRVIEAQHKMRPRVRIADPKAIPVRDRGSNMSLRDQYRRLGFHFQDGTNNVDTRVTALGQLIAQGRFVVTSDCMETFDQIQQYRWEDLTPDQRERGREAKPLKRNVDLVDAAQYIACRYVAPPKFDPLATDLTPQEEFAQDVQAAIRRKLATRTATRAHDLGNIIV
jgi:PBSX family phage terminase large subunit